MAVVIKVEIFMACCTVVVPKRLDNLKPVGYNLSWNNIGTTFTGGPMMNKRYTASKTRSQGRRGWTVIFRHPKLRDSRTGNFGKRVRRGLDTQDEFKADQLVAELNQLLGDESFHDPGFRLEAKNRFDPLVVNIFYDPWVPENYEVNFKKVREEYIPLPSSSNSDYRQVLLLGTTGAGKTTLVRQLIGTKLDERFPSTSTAKTTIHDTEIVLDGGPNYRAIVTFFSESLVRDHLEECVFAAALEIKRRNSDEEIMRRLLNHVDQRFRFSYVLGNGPANDLGDPDGEYWDNLDDEYAEDDSEDDSDIGNNPNLEETNRLLENVLSELKGIVERYSQMLQNELVHDGDDRTEVEEIIEEVLDELLREDEAFHRITENLLQEIKKRFDLLDQEQLTYSSGWPVSWRRETTNRNEFIEEVTKFSSNYAKRFGELLTPLVNGVRVAGPFEPLWGEGLELPLVLIDGEGLGHATNQSSLSVIPTKVTRLIQESDTVLLVDNAKQPMQAASQAAIQEILSSGHISKLVLAFTHVDSVEGDNLPNLSSRIKHVIASAENVIASLSKEFGLSAERSLRTRINRGATYFLADIDKNKLSKYTRGQLKEMLGAFVQVVEQETTSSACPNYSLTGFTEKIQRATGDYQDTWFHLLGLITNPDIPKEHWARIKALSRRLATRNWGDEYNHLKPVADLHKRLQNEIYKMVQNPSGWSQDDEPDDGPDDEPDDDQKQQRYDRFAGAISEGLLDLASKRVHQSKFEEWEDAYELRGTGSTRVRATIIGNQIIEDAAPISKTISSPLLHEVLEVIEQAADVAKVKIKVDIPGRKQERNLLSQEVANEALKV